MESSTRAVLTTVIFLTATLSSHLVDARRNNKPQPAAAATLPSPPPATEPPNPPGFRCATGWWTPRDCEFDGAMKSLWIQGAVDLIGSAGPPGPGGCRNVHDNGYVVVQACPIAGSTTSQHLTGTDASDAMATLERNNCTASVITPDRHYQYESTGGQVLTQNSAYYLNILVGNKTDPPWRSEGCGDVLD